MSLLKNILCFGLFAQLMACGQKGALYHPETKQQDKAKPTEQIHPKTEISYTASTCLYSHQTHANTGQLLQSCLSSAAYALDGMIIK